MQEKLAVAAERAWAGLVAMAMLLSACSSTESGGDRRDATVSEATDTRPAETDLRADATEPLPDLAAPPADAAADQRPTELPDATAADLRRRDSASAPDGSIDVRPSDARPADAATAADGAPAPDAASPNHGAVTTLTAIAANTTIGLDWPRVAGATGYRVYWATEPGVGQGSAALESTEPALVHRGLENGTAYHYAVAAMTASGEGELSAEVTATPGGEWVLEELGAGDFDDVVTGGRVSRLAVEDRIHVLLFAEGYLASELGKLHDLGTHDGTRGNDVDRWVDEIFRIEPYPQLRPAFVIWYLPRASAAHLGEGTTAFGVTVAGGGVDTVTAVATPLFAALDGEGADAFPFPPPAPVVNHVAAFLLYDPARGRAGLSGVTTTLQNPGDRNQRLATAFGVGHAHEFTHAFASLRDEYLETSNSPRSASETANTSPTSTCATLPWAHLLEGAGINTTPELVGAFGTAELGYHPELKCLMNGTHDNGQFFCQAGSSGGYPNLTLRSDDRMCNFCREITAYRVFERARLLPGTSGFATWKSDYRAPFYRRFGFKVPSPVPQTVKCPEDSAARPVFQACAP